MNRDATEPVQEVILLCLLRFVAELSWLPELAEERITTLWSESQGQVHKVGSLVFVRQYLKTDVSLQLCQWFLNYDSYPRMAEIAKEPRSATVASITHFRPRTGAYIGLVAWISRSSRGWLIAYPAGAYL
jgi:hypothetical protein